MSKSYSRNYWKNDDIADEIKKFIKNPDTPVEMTVPRMEKFLKISSYMPCRVR